MSVPVKEDFTQHTRVSYAGFWLRLAAWMIDSFITVIAYYIIIFGIAFTNLPETFAVILIIIFTIAGDWLYYALMESSDTQGTVGKMIIGLKVTDVNGHKTSFARATGRYFGKWISNFILYIGYIMASFTEKKQALHDMIAGCLVVKK